MPSPNGSGGAPRQGWINAADGNLYRLWFFTFAQGFNRRPEGQRLPRLLHDLHAVEPSPGADHRTSPSCSATTPSPACPSSTRTGRAATTSQSHTGFGDISFTPRVLLHETKDFSLTAELAVVTPTGNQPLAGKTTP